MAIALGRNARIKKNNVEIAKCTSGTFSGGSSTIDLSTLGDSWDKFDVGMNNYTMTINTLMVTTSTEQNALFTAWAGKTKLTDLEIYIDSTTSIVVDTATDTEAGMFITGYNVNFDNGSAVGVEITIQGSGPIKKE